MHTGTTSRLETKTGPDKTHSLHTVMTDNIMSDSHPGKNIN